MAVNPFNQNTKLARMFTILSDGELHCGKHELPGTQPAKAIQIMRQHGFSIENVTRYCPVCDDRTVHRRLISTVPSTPSFVRQPIPKRLRQRVLEHYRNTESITLREMLPGQPEVDHRFPQVRWSTDESFDPDMPEAELHARFQLLTRDHSLWKSRYCERCAATGERGTFIGINYFAHGDPSWNHSIPTDDPRGCFGCFWYDPDAWRQAVNAALARSKPTC